MNKQTLLNKKLLSGIAFLWALAGVTGGLANASAQQFLRVARAAAIRTADNAVDADDLASEVALRYLRSRGSAAAVAPDSEGYIVQSVRNVHRQWLRKSQRTQCVADHVETEGTEFLGLSTGVADPSFQAEVHELFEALSGPEKAVLDGLVQGLGEREIAETTGESRYRVRETIESIRKQARELVS